MAKLLVLLTASLSLTLAFLCLGCQRGAPPSQAQAEPWYHNAVIYEVYPRSFADTNGDGVGDLNGITAHLDYLKDLGVDAIWITPFFPSPQVDFGYDISDYQGIDPQYGSMQDLDRLIAGASARNIRTIVDLVLNHTSDKHPWFVESSSSRNNPKADWYVWQDAKPGGRPPNNWQSIFGGSAWQASPTRGQMYYHAFYTQQPDLNWRNSEVRNAMYDTVRFWLRKGVAGFRLDAVQSLFEDQSLRDESTTPVHSPTGIPNLAHEYTSTLPEIHDVLRELRRVADEFPDRVLIPEFYSSNGIEGMAKMYGANHDEAQLPMDTELIGIDQLSADAFRAKLRDAETRLNGNMPLLVTDNHDVRRSASRYGDGTNDIAISKLVATLLLAPRSSALLYYGQEIGMVNNDPKRREDVRDPVGKRGWPAVKGRDGERTPMQWSGTANAGFSAAGSTWLPVAPDYPARNVDSQLADPASLLNYYKALIRLRKNNPALRGSFALVNESDPNVLSWIRTDKQGKTVLVALNVSAAPQRAAFNLDPQGLRGKQAVTLLSSYSNAGEISEIGNINLPAYGSLIAEIR